MIICINNLSNEVFWSTNITFIRILERQYDGPPVGSRRLVGRRSAGVCDVMDCLARHSTSPSTSGQESGCFLLSREPPPRALQVEGYPDAGDPLVLLQHILVLLAINRSEQEELDGLRIGRS